MEKYSVKKPFTVLVAVIAVIALGVVSMTSMSMDLLPDIGIPYLMVMTPYPGASPEKVEIEVSSVMENALGTISHVENVYSVSSENFSMVQLEFEDDTDMDSAMVKVSSAVEQARGSLPDGAGSPSILELSMDMIASMYIAVEREGYDIYELSDYVRDEFQPSVERVSGVASVSTIGLVDQTVRVELNSSKIDSLNEKILRMTEDALSEAEEQLDDARAQVEEGQKTLEEQERSFGSMLSSGIITPVRENSVTIADGLKTQIENTAASMETISQKLTNAYEGLKNTVDASGTDFNAAYESAKEKVETLSEAAARAKAAYEKAKADLEAKQEAAESSVQEGLAKAAEDAKAAMELADEDLAAAMKELQDAEAALQEAAGTVQEAADITPIVEELADAAAELRETASVLDGSSFSTLMSGVNRLSALIPRITGLLTRAAEYAKAANADVSPDAARDGVDRMKELIDQAPEVMDTLEQVLSALTQGQLDAAVGFSTAANQLSLAQSQLASAQAQYESARESALENANADALLSASTLSQMIFAQNFSMPAGYISDEDGTSWLLKVGDEYETREDISDILLIDMDEIGPVRLSDVADVTVIDNAGDSYAKLNGQPAVVLSIFKNSSVGTNELSRNLKKAIEDISARDEGTEVATLMDQGDYISMIIEDIVRNMLLGAVLAIIILALFIKDVRPTLLVAIAIPLSVLFALVLMYFSKLSLNIMTLSGLALGIGMLVDNSIVVIENIFRLRGRDIPAPRAAVQGARQVSGAITASTLTTVCVFMPMVFTTGTVRELMVPMALSISFCLLASLVVAMTVVPAASSSIMRNVTPKKNRFMDKVQNIYGKTLRWCLKNKLMTLLAAILLLALSLVRLVTMGIVVLPEMNGDDIQVNIRTPEEATREESYAMVDEVIKRISGIEGVGDVGAMDSGSTAGFLGSFGGGSDSYGVYICYVQPESGEFSDEVSRLCEKINAVAEDLPCEVSASTGGMSDLSSFSASGLSINVYGDDLDDMNAVSEELMEIIGEVKGFEEISNGSEDAAETLQLVIDKDKAMAAGLTVAQIYAEIAARLTTSVTSTSISSNGITLDVVIEDKTRELTRENILDIEFDASASSGASMMGAMAGGQASSMASAMGGSGSSSLASMMGSMAGASGEETSGEGEGEEKEEEEEAPKSHKLSEFASLKETYAQGSIRRENLTRYITVSAKTQEGYNTELLTRELKTRLAGYTPSRGISYEIAGESTQINDMVTQMSKLMALALLFIYLVMVAQFQSLLSPFIVMFTIPLAFTGGMIGLILANEQLSMLSLMGFLILMGTVVNNGIVFVDYANQLRMGGMERRDALVATGKTRMRPILMTAMTTILAMSSMIVGGGMGSQMGRGMAIVIAAGLIYSTFMTLYIIPVIYDILFKRQPLLVDVGSDLDDAPDDAAEFIEQMRREREGK
ncbi:MAG: efflux RND transporter permease subunit [Lachnospiraceae bacterium]|nr:efflux RND transporter permease subunit [Lachnospiraceae bacterium]